MELKVPMVVVSQLRKSLDPRERKHPTLQRLYGSGAKSKHASIVLYIDRPFVTELTGDETKARICILKNRDGRLGQIDCWFDIKTGRFKDSQNEIPETKQEEAQQELPINEASEPSQSGGTPERKYTPLGFDRRSKRQKERDRSRYEPGDEDA